MEALVAYLEDTATAPDAFARLIGLDRRTFGEYLSGARVIKSDIARRIVDACGGALALEDILGAEDPVLDLRARMQSAGPEIDIARLAEALAPVLPLLLGGARRAGDQHLPSLAAEAAAHTYAALSTITTRQGPDRLTQALRPVFEEILSESEAGDPAFQRLPLAIDEAVALYFQASPKHKAS